MRHIFTLLALLISTAVSAREVLNLNDDWRIFPASKSSGDDAYTISLPHCWGYDPSTPPSLTNANYLRTIYAPAEWEQQRIFLKFYGVQSICDLFVNGVYVGEHRGGSTAFSFEISKYLNFDDDNAISLRVSSATQNDVLPTSIEHAIYGGIYRDVELIVTPQVAISPTFYGSDGVFVTTREIKGEKVEGDVKVMLLAGESEERAVEITISDMEGTVCYSNRHNKMKVSGSTPLVIPFSTKNIKLWSPSEPNLYRVTVKISPLASVIKEQEQEIELAENLPALQSDEVSVVTGFRTIAIAEETAQNRAIRVNDEPIQMRGVSLYHDNPIEGSVMSSKIYNSELRLIKEMGANAIRSAVTPHDRALYSLCDERGIMVWVDTPLARSSFFSDVAYYPTSRFERNGEEQLREIIYQNYNHPSVMMWGIFSLLTVRGDNPFVYVNKLNKIAKSIDKTRPTVALSNQNGDINDVADLVVWQQSLGWEQGELSDIQLWQKIIHERWSRINSAVMFGEKGVIYHQMDRSGIEKLREDKRSVGWYPEARQTEMHEEYMKYLAADSLFWGVWNTAMFDYRSSRSSLGENSTGLITFDRTTRKDSYFLYRALWNKERPTLHIADRRGRILKDSLLTLHAYASCDTVAPVATIRDQEFVMRNVAPSQFVLDSIEIIGKTNIVVRQGNLADSVEFTFGSPLKAREQMTLRKRADREQKD